MNRPGRRSASPWTRRKASAAGKSGAPPREGVLDAAADEILVEIGLGSIENPGGDGRSRRPQGGGQEARPRIAEPHHVAGDGGRVQDVLTPHPGVAAAAPARRPGR